MNIKRQIASIQPLFEQYLKTGYYPFYKEVRQGYYLRLQNVVNTVLEVDYPQIDDVSVSTIEKTKKMLTTNVSRQHLIYKNISLRDSLLTIKGEL